MSSIRLTAAALATLGLALAAVPATAGQPAGIQLAQAESFSDEKIESFAMAALEVSKIRNDYVGRIQQAGSEEERQQLAEQATSEMVDAVEATPGITTEEYNAIIQAAQGDQALSDRIKQQIQSASQ